MRLITIAMAVSFAAALAAVDCAAQVQPPSLKPADDPPPGVAQPDPRGGPPRFDPPGSRRRRGGDGSFPPSQRPRPRLGDPMPPSAIGLPGPPHLPHGPGSLESLRERDPEMYELEKADREHEQQSFELVQAFRQAPRENRETIKSELAKLVEKHFAVRQQRRELQLQRLEEELQRMRESIERRNEAQRQIISRRVAELIGEEDDLGF